MDELGSLKDYWQDSSLAGYNGAYNRTYYPGANELIKTDFNGWFNNMLTGSLDYQRELAMVSADMAYNSREADKERAWQKEMRDTSYISQVNQYKALGMNPYLTLGGSGASTPSGPTASHNGSHRSASGSAFSSLFSSLLGSAVNMANAELNREASMDRLAVSRNSNEAIARDRLASLERMDDKRRKYSATRDWMRNERFYTSKKLEKDPITLEALMDIISDFYDLD